MTAAAKKDTQTRFHEEWLGLAQPIEGLVFSIPALADAQITPQPSAELSVRFRQWVDEERSVVQHLRAFFDGFLGYSTPGMLVERDALHESISFYAEEGRQEIRPSFAVARGPFTLAEDDVFAGFGADVSDDSEASQEDDSKTAEEGKAKDQSPYVFLVWDVRDDAGDAGTCLPLDKSEDVTGPWRYPPTAKFERLLRHTNIPVGFISNGCELRLVYAPAGESTSHLTFRFADMKEQAGRPLLAAFELLVGAERTYQAAAEHTLEGLLRESRERQADVTHELAGQVFEAVEILLDGFERAAQRSGPGEADWLTEALRAPDDHLYQGVLSVVLRLVFLLYAEDEGLLPVGHSFYAKHLSVKGLYDDLVDDAGMHPESMNHRFGAYGRLLALFRAVFLGVQHGELSFPPRRGRLFDPSSFPFLEGGLPGSTAAIVSPDARAQVQPPAVDDGVIHAVLERLVVFQGQRLSYKTLDVEQIGSVYESLMGYHVQRVTSPSIRLGKNRMWAETAKVRSQSPTERKRFLKKICGLSTSQQTQVNEQLAEHDDNDALAEAMLELAPGGKRERHRHRAVKGKLVLQPGEERRRSGSHYTPRSLTVRIVSRTLEPILKCLGEEPTEEQILSLKISDPAMGSGAFLVAACRHLADHLVVVWTREGRLAGIAERTGDPHLHARRLVAQRCLYGVDKNAAAVELAKLSLWLVTMNAELPFTFIDHALRHGDSLVGLDLEQIAAFHWKPKKQLDVFNEALRDALDQAIEHRQELLELATRDDVIAQQEKRRLLDHAEHATERMRIVADVCVGAFFSRDKNKARENERARRESLVQQYLAGDSSLESALRGMADEIREQHAPFHWWLEFPEVFYEERPDPLAADSRSGATYMEAFVGNPPFMGGRGISEQFGSAYNAWLTLSPRTTKNADLAGHFFRRVAVLLGDHGSFGLIATNTIAQGDTREAGLTALVKRGWKIYDATTSMPWPGNAAVTVSVVQAAVGLVRGAARPKLDGLPVDVINSRLRAKPERPDSVGLSANSGLAYQGSIVRGIGFTLTPEERRELVEANPRNDQRIAPYLGGDEVTSSPWQNFERYVIDFDQMSLEEAEAWPDLLEILRRRVKSEREATSDAKDYPWWWFWRPRVELYAAITRMGRCLVTARLSKHLVISFQPTDRVFSEQLYIFPFDSYAAFAVLQSRIHETWARLLSSSFEDRLRYVASDCFDTFPFPDSDPRTVQPNVDKAGEVLYERRARFMMHNEQGLTATYNAIKDPHCSDPGILNLRQIHEMMDSAVLNAYGWSDLVVPPFCPVNDEEREQLVVFEDEVIDRLYVLNAERAREEQRLGAGQAKGKRTRKSKATQSQANLFPGEAE